MYGIIANEISEETNIVYWPACAKDVPHVMEISMRQVMVEISEDYADTMMIRMDDAEKIDER